MLRLFPREVRPTESPELKQKLYFGIAALHFIPLACLREATPAKAGN